MQDVDPRNFSERLEDDLRRALTYVDPDGRTLSIHERLKAVVATRTEDKLYRALVNDLPDNITPANDGALWIMDGPLKKLLEEKQATLSAMQSSLSATGSVSGQDVKAIGELSGEIDKIQEILRNHSRSSNPFTAQFGGGSFKGEAGVRFMDDIIGSAMPGYTFTGNDPKAGMKLTDKIQELEFLDKQGKLSLSEGAHLSDLRRLQAGGEFLERFLTVSPKTNLKKEMGNELSRSLTLNVSTSHDSTVFTDPMGLLVDPESMNPQNQAAIRANLDATQERLDEFFKTGQIPKEVLDELEYEAKQMGLITSKGTRRTTPKIVGTDLDESLLNASDTALAKRNRAEIQQIFDLLQQGNDPKSIPQLVNRIRNNNARQAFRIKDDQINLALPFSSRSDIRTFESEGENIPGIFEEGMEVRKAKLKDGSVVNVPVIQSAMKGDKMMITGINASQQKGALSTFDLDDKAIKSLRTYVDENGKTRILQMIERDPKGLQETFYTAPNLSHAETFQSFFQGTRATNKKMLESFSTEIISDEARQEFIDQGLNPDAIDSTYSQARIMLAQKNGTFGFKSTRGSALLKTQDEYLIAEAMITRAARLAIGSPIPQMSDTTLSTLSSLGSASIRGRNAIDRATGMTVQVAKSLGPEQSAPYSLKNVSEFMIQSAPAEETMAETLRLVNSQLPPGASKLTLEQLGPFMKGTYSVGGLSVQDAKQIGTFAIEQLNEMQSLKALASSEVRNTIGVSSNRAAIVASSQNMIDDAIKRGGLFEQFGSQAAEISKRVSARYGIGTIAPSNVVDLVKQVSGGNVVRPLAEVLKDNLTEQERSSVISAYKALARIGERRGMKIAGAAPTAYTVSSFDIGDVLEAGIEQSGKFVGYARAAAMAAGKTSGELVGFDPVAFAERMKGSEDRAANRMSILSGMVDYLRDAKGNVPISQRKRVMDEIKRLRAMGRDEFDESILLQPGTPAYEEYANTSKAFDISIAEEVRQAANDQVRNRSAARSQKAIGVAEYRKISRDFLRRSEMSGIFSEMEAIGEEESIAIRAGKKLSEGNVARRAKLKSMAAMQMSTSLRAIRDNYPSGNLLDIMDTLESEMVSIYGQQGRNLFTQLGEIGAEDQMMSIYSLALQRRGILSQSTNTEHFDYVQQLYRDHKGSGSEDLSKLTPREAGEFVRFDRSLKDGERRMAPELFDFMRLRARTQTALGHLKGEPIDSLSANQALKTIQLKEASAEVERQLAEITESETFAGPATEDAARLAEELGTRDIDDRIGPIARSPYKRITESFQGGELKKLLESKNVRRSGVAAIALIGASFLYQRNKRKDLTEADVSGPPLLPGGSAYEDRPATRQMALQSAQMQSQGYGMQYQVNTTGSMGDLNKLRGLFGDVVDGPINSTMYNGMPSLGKDPYSDIASNF
jgi:hypothetical protein